MRISSAPGTSHATSSRLPRTTVSSRVSTLAAGNGKRPIRNDTEAKSTRYPLEATPTKKFDPVRPKQRLETAAEVASREEPVDQELR